MVKSFLPIFLLLFLLNHLNAQLLVSTPTFPKDTGSIAITMDASKGNKALLNYSNTSDVYVHIGVITNLSSGPSDWKHVKFTNFNAPDPTVKATYLGNNKYRFVIDKPREFFNLGATETIEKIAILFRNGNGTVVQRNSDGSDMFVSMAKEDFSGKFLQPYFEPRFKPIPEPIQKSVGETIDVAYVTNQNAKISIYFNGIKTAEEVSGNIIAATLNIDNAGSQQIIATATSNSITVRDTIEFYVATPSLIKELPAGARDGINYEEGDTSVVLVLYAPSKSRVSVIGEFNNWTESTGYQMFRTPDNNRFWIRVTGLQPGKEYAYQYLVNSSLRIADPYTEKVLDPDNDRYISAATYPSLKPYPAGKTTGIVSVLQTASPDHSWKVPDFKRPDQKSLVIYELLLRDFIEKHDWKTLTDSLNYFKKLGVNAIQLMPVQEFEGNLSWGYNTSFYFAPDKYYGPSADLKKFIDEAHQAGIAVILDIALNHSFGQSPMVQLYFDNGANRPDPSNPWFNPVAKHAYNVGYDMNHQSPTTQYFTSRVVEHWLKEYRVDGFRFDLSKGFTQKNTCDGNGANCDVSAWSAYDSTRIRTWKNYYDTVQSKSSNAYVILEHFADNTEEKELASYGMMLWGNANHAFNEATMGYVSNSDLGGAFANLRSWEQPHLVAYMESHDEERIQYKNSKYGNSSGVYSVKDLATGLKRNEMAAAFLLMIPGPKMLWQFGELGYDYSINHCTDGTVKDACRLDPKPIRWDYLQHPGRKRLHDVYSALIKLRTHTAYQDAFQSNQVQQNVSAKGFKWIKVTTDTSNLVVIGNFDVVPQTAVVQFQHTGTWYDYLSGRVLTVNDAAQTITLQPGEYHIYLNRNITEVLTPVGNIGQILDNASLRVYPNPVSRNGNIEIAIPANGTIRLNLVDLHGRLVGKPYSRYHVKGKFTIGLNSLMQEGERLPDGSYFLTMETGSIKKVQQLFIQY